MNSRASKEWLVIAYHDLKSADILYDANHYTDTIGKDLQQAIEKILKSTLAYKNRKIPKSHDLYEIYTLCDDIVIEDREIDFLYRATEYFKEDRYPNLDYCLPEREEIAEVLEFAQKLFGKVCDMLEIDEDALK